jgi:uncharacterized protein (TIGR03067 family)
MNLCKLWLLGVTLIFTQSFAAQAQKEKPKDDDLKKLQGIWQVTKWIESEGTPAPADEIKGTTWEFKEDRMITRSNGMAREPLKFTLNSSKSPKWINILGLEVAEGIYKLEGDEFSVCVVSGSMSGQRPERPTEFKANEKKHHTLFVFKKVKK